MEEILHHLINAVVLVLLHANTPHPLFNVDVYVRWCRISVIGSPCRKRQKTPTMLTREREVSGRCYKTGAGFLPPTVPLSSSSL